ncbi:MULTISPECIES: zinc-ribbon domain-containing protein [Synergistaceae]|jgi:rubrerythrin|uniref:zinc ribbon domain-containing protein n=1 Tax=Synergistaceae TaxID=649777 RepID=UPI003ADC8591|nr:zinc ribbon domain-containing protein [Synergistaceae bacterium DZ-S4]
MRSFTDNYEDNSTDAGFQFVFHCDKCGDGYKSEFIESTTYRKGRGLRGLVQGVSMLGGLIGGGAGDISSSLERGINALSERFEGMSPDWHKEHQAAFEKAMNEARERFHRCDSCSSWVCDSCFNENERLCTECAPRQEVYAAKARSDAMRRNIDEAAGSATVWKDKLEGKAKKCPACGKPAGNGKFCGHCGASLAEKKCPDCGRENPSSAKFCTYCGASMSAVKKDTVCPECGAKTEPGLRFCSECGHKLS